MTTITNKPIILSDVMTGGARPECGALATFFGMVRNVHHGRNVKKLYYECYVPMAERQIALIRAEMMAKYRLSELSIIHRIGELGVGEIAIAVAGWSGHREEAFSGCREAVEKIKHEVPIWKKEYYEDGAYDWVSCLHEKN